VEALRLASKCRRADEWLGAMGGFAEARLVGRARLCARAAQLLKASGGAVARVEHLLGPSAHTRASPIGIECLVELLGIKPALCEIESAVAFVVEDLRLQSSRCLGVPALVAWRGVRDQPRNRGGLRRGLALRSVPTIPPRAGRRSEPAAEF
jgi:hypothetical protein